VIYLDHNATTKPSDAVAAAVARATSDLWGNPSSVHRFGQSVRREVELARQSVADLLGVKARELVFTSGGTESIDLCIRGVLDAIPKNAAKRGLVTSRAEHSAVRDLAESLAKDGTAVQWMPLLEGGIVDVAALPAMLDGSVALVSIQWANNETGVVQPVQEIGNICREKGVLFHCDATQWIGKETIRGLGASPGVGAHGQSTTFAELHDPSDARARARASDNAMENFDLLTSSAHKFHGPKGVGVAWMRPGVRLRPQLQGSQELGRRGGTENVPGILGMGVAAMEAREWLSDPSKREAQRGLRDVFEREIVGAIPDAVVNGANRNRLWNTSNIGFPRLEAEALLMLLSERGVCASAGAACSSGSLEPSPVLLAMGIPEPIAHGSLRFSLGKHTTREEVIEAVGIVVESVRKLRVSMPGQA